MSTTDHTLSAMANPKPEKIKGIVMKGIDKRINQDGSISYRARVRVKGHPPVIKTFNSLTIAKKWKKDTEVDIEKGRYFDTIESQKHTLSEAIHRYIKSILPGKPKDAKNVHRHLLWWNRELGHYSLDCIKPSLLVEKKELLLSELIKKGKTRSPATVVRYISSLSHVFTIMLKEWGWVTENPVRKVRKPPLSNHRTRFLSESEKVQLLEACQKSSCKFLYIAVILALSTGMRYGEIMKLKKRDIDIERGVITLEETKNGDTRSIPLVDAPLTLLKERLAVTLEAEALLFPSPNNPEKPLDIRSSWEKAVKLANIVDFRFHDLRHTVASYLAMSGYGLLDIGILLGHKDMQSTKRYAHLSQEHKQRMVTTMTKKILG